jgi:broad specificity phosphatase PhoE
MRVFAAALLLLPAVAACGGGPSIVLLRHAEKGPGRDPDLSGDGKRRALALVDVARTWGAAVVIHTPFKRTAQTVEPLATHLGIPLRKVDYTPGQEEAHADAVLTLIREQYPYSTVVIAGHTTTLPVIMRKLGVESPRAIPETEYGTLFIVRNGGVIEQRWGE